MNLHLHPKIRNAAIAAFLVAVVSIANAIVNVYPDAAWVQILAALIPVVVGYQTRSDPNPVATPGP